MNRERVSSGHSLGKGKEMPVGSYGFEEVSDSTNGGIDILNQPSTEHEIPRANSKRSSS